MIHGKQSIEKVESSTDAFFGLKNLQQQLAVMSSHDFEQHFKDTPRVKSSESNDISSLIVKCGLRKSKSEVKRLIQLGGLQINGACINQDRKIGDSDKIHSKYMVVKAGKKQFALVEF